MAPVRHVVYLHGFASSPKSTKARWFGAELSKMGVGFSCPDFNEPDFETLTVTRMLDQTDEAIAAAGPGPIALMGSSLGGFVAVHAAARQRNRRQTREPTGPRRRSDTPPAVDRLVLLAPAFDFGGNRLRQFGPHGIDAWRRAGRIRMFHYGWNEERDIGFGLYEDAARYDAFHLADELPTLIVQGTRDQAVDPAMVQTWARPRANVRLHLVEDDHQLTASIPEIWEWTRRFLELR